MLNSIELRRKLENFIIESNTPITEQSNKLTKNIDLASNGEDILNLLFKTDLEIFNGWSYEYSDLKSDGLKNDLYIIDKIINLAQVLYNQINEHLKPINLNKKRFKIILSGCGTSGRIAYLCSQTFNIYLNKKLNLNMDYNICDYIIAGDDNALVNSVESVEDKPIIGAEKLKSILDQKEATKCVFIGITCGLSAPFVAGQIDYCLKELESQDSKVLACGLIGFNPVKMTRKTQLINDKNENFYDLMLKMEELESSEPKKYFILNPLIGPEPITGSTRMKSGTTTKIILDLILTKIISLIQNENIQQNLELKMLSIYENVLKNVIYCKSTISNLAQLIDKCADSLMNLENGGSINYLSDSESLGLLACVDASECLPTYGASKNDIKGFVTATNNSSLSNNWSGFIKTCISTWSQNILSNPKSFESSKCTFVFINNRNESFKNKQDIPNKELVENFLLKNSKCTIYNLNLYDQSDTINKEQERIKNIYLTGLNEMLDYAELEINEYFKECLIEFALKLCLNSVSTGAHVLFGKTYENIMIDVKVSNVKLYWRAVNIIRNLSGINSNESEDYLLKSIYQGTIPIEKTQIENHIQVATGQNFVVPKALVMALSGVDYIKSACLLNEYKNSVRNCLFNLKKA